MRIVERGAMPAAIRLGVADVRLFAAQSSHLPVRRRYVVAEAVGLGLLSSWVM
ncbi:MAG: hypothetical protein JWQ19_3223 [Subtercola sp.]|nr:hypothetical protein [Subtercola sp.]